MSANYAHVTDLRQRVLALAKLGDAVLGHEKIVGQRASLVTLFDRRIELPVRVKQAVSLSIVCSGFVRRSGPE